MHTIYRPLLLSAASVCLISAGQPTNHVDMADMVLDFLSRTELCLNSCVDAATTQAAIHELKKLAAEAEQIATAQRDLPDPTVQDFMAVQHHMGQFNNIWNAICKHIQRLEKAGLMSDEIRQILKIAG